MEALNSKKQDGAITIMGSKVRRACPARSPNKDPGKWLLKHGNLGDKLRL